MFDLLIKRTFKYHLKSRTENSGFWFDFLKISNFSFFIMILVVELLHFMFLLLWLCTKLNSKFIISTYLSCYNTTSFKFTFLSLPDNEINSVINKFWYDFRLFCSSQLSRSLLGNNIIIYPSKMILHKKTNPLKWLNLNNPPFDFIFFLCLVFFLIVLCRRN